MTLQDIIDKLQDANRWELYLIGKYIDYLKKWRKHRERNCTEND